MKYPKQQFDKLVKILTELNKHIENLKDLNPSSLHYLVYQQVNEFQSHNALVLTECNQVLKEFQAKGFDFVIKNRLCEIDNDFLLYPNGCNDNHTITAVKNALKIINL